ncbi:ankyrin repeat and LEM domain-containing protein 2 [Ischnura elegans]|uniref:ankyrin repeat and LEM domain-containing protein 2 n=1 Tax=Ischnura elegans TaxID=197161 RepID=UPI001ED8B83D|nr:ankyrin repeat and LEM domain-containing protein 2 [Ischnura elegans]
MDELKTKLLSLTDQELRQYLEESGGYDGTPVTPSTRMLLVRKLTRNMLKGSPVDDNVGDKTSGRYPSVDSSGSRLVECGDQNKVSGEQDVAKQDLNLTYYGIHIPRKLSGCSTSAPEESCVLTDKKEVMKYMKDYPHARFKVFRSRDEAEAFAKRGVNSSGDAKELCKGRELTANNIEPAAVTEEKTSSFKGPKPQELIQLRKTIERGDINKFLETVWKNPRYMVSSGDTPTILQEGSRYNALHIACKAGSGPMVEAILETISNPAFINLLYDGTKERGLGSEILSPMPTTEGIVSEVKDKAVVECVMYLQDSYLNTPEKGLNETPLHFACKFGKVEAVKVLMSYPACDRMRLNKFGESAEDMICSRAGKGTEAEKEIRQILKDCFYVPVLRPGDSSLQASVGDPFSPEKLPSPVLAMKMDPKSPTKEINAFAGPMSLDKAQEFCLKLKSPLRSKFRENENFGPQTPKCRVSSPKSFLFSGSPLRLCDPERGLEREGRALAKEFHVGWKEYWPFAGVYTDLGTKEGMQILESYLHKKLIDILNGKKKPDGEIVGETDVDTKRLTTIAIADEKDTDHINQQMSPVSDLCLAMQSCQLSSSKKSPKETNNPPSLLNATCQPNSTEESQPCHSPSPLHYVEKSCIIFARRISDLILREACGEKKRDFSRVIGMEVHHLRRLISSFKDDPRFSSIDFSCMHSRVASLAAEALLEALPSASVSTINIINALGVMQGKHVNLCSSSDEDDDRLLEKERYGPFGVGGKEWRVSMRHGISRVDCADGVDEHAQCLITLIEQAMQGYSQNKCDIPDESNSIKLLWENAKSCSCSWPTSPHYHSKVSNRSVAAVVRKLSFDKLSENLEDINKNGPDNSRKTENPELRGDSIREGDRKDFFQRYRNYSGDSDHSSREDANSDTFYTPPSSPLSFDGELCSSGDEEMFDSEEMPKVFIGGEHPSKEDLDVLNALEKAASINPKEFPHIYQWRSLVLMHTHEERESWPSPYSPRWIKQPRKCSVRSCDKVLFC